MRHSWRPEAAPVGTGRRTEDGTSRDERDAGIAGRFRGPCSFSLCVQLPLNLWSRSALTKQPFHSV